jgi:hypothetical protein
MTEPDDAWADWVTIWQSELAAMAADRELQEMIQRGVDLWAAHALSLAPKREAGSPGAIAPSRPTPAVAASGDAAASAVEPGGD